MKVQLDQQQMAVVNHDYGPLLVTAVAGAGKTTAMVHRMARLVQSGKAKPEDILATTFTRRAAREMNVRLKSLGVKKVRVGTFHSICYDILRFDGEKYGGKYRIKGELPLNQEVMHQINAEVEVTNVSMIRSFISWCKNWLVSPKRAMDFPYPVRRFQELNGYDKNVMNRLVDAYARIEAWRKDRRILTFDDILYQSYRCLSKEKDVLKKWQARYKFVIVDEFQDSNKAQYEIMCLLAAPQNNLVCVGDDDQSIYGWRGSVPKFMLRFEKVFKSKVIRMETNYRSLPGVAIVANKIIKNNEKRLEKKIRPFRKGSKECVEFFSYSSPESEAHSIAQTVRKMVNQDDMDYGDFAVLYRANRLSDPIQSAMTHAQIPFVVIGGMMLYDYKIIKDLLAYLQYARAAARKKKFKPKYEDRDALYQILNVPKRALGPSFVSRMMLEADEKNITLLGALGKIKGNKQQEKGLESFENLMGSVIRMVRKKSRPTDVLEHIIEETGYVAAISPDEKFAKFADAKVQRLLENAKGMRTTEEFLDYIDQLLIDGADSDEEDDEDHKVKLMTIHKSKGLEFPVVFVPGWTEGNMPHSMSVETGDIEEERRLAYVSITRAKELCVLSHCENVGGASPFIVEAGLQ